MLDIKTCNKSVEESAKALATLMASEKDILSKDAREKKFVAELVHNTEILQKKLYNGLKASVDGLALASSGVMTREAVLKELGTCIQHIGTQEELASMGENLFSDNSWKKQLGISTKCMQALYQGARALFENRDYERGEEAFYVICCLDPSQFAYWIGLGHASFQNKNYGQQ